MNISDILLKISVAGIWSKVWPFLVAIVFFGLIITIHEFGHFITAKLFKVKVNEFAIGMGPAIFKKKRGETQYSLRILPIGGYVSMEGENEDSEDERAFCNKKAWQRLIVLAAGAVNNLILGLVFVIALTCMSDLVGTRVVHSFTENAISCETGLEQGDEILRINGTRIFTDRDIDYCMIRDDDGVYDMVVRRDGEKKTLENVKFEVKENETGKNTIIFDFIIVGEKKNPLNVIKTSVLDTFSMARLVWLTLFDLVTGHYGINDLSGPVGAVTIVAQVTEQAAKGGIPLDTIIYIMALITINIGVFNLLPIPALDGGRLFFVFIEIIFRKPVPQKYEGIIHAVGMVLLLAFMAFVTFNDIKNLITGKLQL